MSGDALLKPHEVSYIIGINGEGFIDNRLNNRAVVWTGEEHCDMSVSKITQSTDFVCDPDSSRTELDVRTCEWTHDQTS